MNLNWKLIIKKCLDITKGNHTEKLTFKLKNTNIENVKEFKYLGVIISKNNCSFQPNLKELSKKGLKAVFALNSKIKYSGKGSPKHF